MARIRTIKPEFFTSEDIVGLSPLARLLYVALWCEADKEGRMVWRPKTFKLRYLPADSCDIDALCAELTGAGLVVLYGKSNEYASIPTFGAHQHINPRESASQLPEPDASRRVGTRQSRVGTRANQELTDREEGKGRERKDVCAEPQAAAAPNPPDAPPPVATLTLVDGSEHPISEAQVAEWSAAFPGVDVVQELRQMRAWLHANPQRRKTRRGVEKFAIGWLGREQDRGGTRAKPPPTGTDDWHARVI